MELISLMSFFDWHNIPKQLVIPQNGGSIESSEAVGTLIGFSLVTPGQGGRSLDMHRLVHLAACKEVEISGKIEKVANEGLKLLPKRFLAREDEDWDISSKYSLHAIAVLHNTLDLQVIPIP